MAVDIKKLKQLREETSVSFSLCTKALEQSNNNIDEAKRLLDKWGVEKARSKASRQTNQGALFSYIHHNKKIASLVELLCETDFVAANADFKVLGQDLAMQVASANPNDLAMLLKSPYIKDEGKTIENLLQEYILKIGENIKIGRFVRYEI